MQQRRTFLQLLSGIPLLVATGFTQRAIATQVGAAQVDETQVGAAQAARARDATSSAAEAQRQGAAVAGNGPHTTVACAPNAHDSAAHVNAGTANESGSAAHGHAPFAPSNIALCDVYIAGLQHTQAFDMCLHELLSVGDELVFVREPENAYDKRAIAVYARQGFRIGYLPKWSNYIPAKLLDDRVKLRGSIVKINADEPPWHYVKVRVSVDAPNNNGHPNTDNQWSMN